MIRDKPTAVPAKSAAKSFKENLPGHSCRQQFFGNATLVHIVLFTCTCNEDHCQIF